MKASKSKIEAAWRATTSRSRITPIVMSWPKSPARSPTGRSNGMVQKIGAKELQSRQLGLDRRKIKAGLPVPPAPAAKAETPKAKPPKTSK